MRDILRDLQDRAAQLEEQIGLENAYFERLMLQLNTKQDSGIEHLRAQLRLVHKLLEFTAWHDNVRATLTARIAVAEAAELSIKKSLRAGAEITGSP